MKDAKRKLEMLGKHAKFHHAIGGVIPPPSSDPDVVQAVLAPARYAVEDGDTITCNCGESFTDPSHTQRFSWFNHGHAHNVGSGDV